MSNVKIEPLTLMCKRCGQPFTWIKKWGRNELGRGFHNGNLRQYCDSCRHASNNSVIKEKLKEMRGSVCAKCGTNVNVVVHHIDFDEWNNTESNLVLLCRSCHGKLHASFRHKLGNLKELTRTWIEARVG